MKFALIALALLSQPAFSQTGPSAEYLLGQLQVRQLPAPASASTLTYYLNKLYCGPQPSFSCVAKAGRLGAAKDASCHD